MKVVLTQDVPGLGKAGEIREVAASYGHNDLIRRGYAELAPEGSMPGMMSPLGSMLSLTSISLSNWLKAGINSMPYEVGPLIQRMRSVIDSVPYPEALSLFERMNAIVESAPDDEMPTSLIGRLNAVLDSVSDRMIEAPSLAIPLDLKVAEVELLQKITQGLPSELGQRYSALIAKRDAEELTSDEHEELLSLTDQVEELEAQRVGYLVELARLRNTTVTDLIQELDIRPSVYV